MRNLHLIAILFAGGLGAVPLAASQSSGTGVAEMLRMGTPNKTGVLTVEVELKAGPPRYQTIGTVKATTGTINQGAKPEDKAAAVSAALNEALPQSSAAGKATIGSVGTALVASANTGSNVAVVDIEVDQDGTKQKMGSSAAEAGGSQTTLLQPLWQTLPTRNGHVLGVVFKLYGVATGSLAYTGEAGLVAIETTAGEASTSTWPGATVEQVLGDLAAQYWVRGIPAQMVPGLGLWVPGQLKGMTCWDDGFDSGWRQD